MPLIQNEEANVTAYVRVVKDPTGVLWHSFQKYAVPPLPIDEMLITPQLRLQTGNWDGRVEEPRRNVLSQLLIAVLVLYQRFPKGISLIVGPYVNPAYVLMCHRLFIKSPPRAKRPRTTALGLFKDSSITCKPARTLSRPPSLLHRLAGSLGKFSNSRMSKNCRGSSWRD